MADERNAKQKAADAVWEEAKKDIERHDAQAKENERTNDSGK